MPTVDDLKELYGEEDLSLPEDFRITLPSYDNRGKVKKNYCMISEKLLTEIAKTLYYYSEIVPDEEYDHDAARQLRKISNYKSTEGWSAKGLKSSIGIDLAKKGEDQTVIYVDTEHVNKENIQRGLKTLQKFEEKYKNKLLQDRIKQLHGKAIQGVGIKEIWLDECPALNYKKCDCGSEKAGTSLHANWCSKGN